MLFGIVVMATVGCWVDAVVFMFDTAVEGMVERVDCVVRVAVKTTDCHSSNKICVQKKVKTNLQFSNLPTTTEILFTSTPDNRS